MPTKIWSPAVSALPTDTRRSGIAGPSGLLLDCDDTAEADVLGESGIAGPSGLLLDCLEVQFRGVARL